MAFQLIVMGVSGCGKSTIGEALAEQLGYPYHDGDSYHPAENIDKMRQGQPLTDADRQGWLKTLNHVLLSEDNGVVLACSALKPDYRQILTSELKRPIFVYLKGNFDTIWQRHKNRKNHYFQGKSMLKSQFNTLVEPTGDRVITVDISLNVGQIVQQVSEILQNKKL